MWVRLDDNFEGNPKVIAAGECAAGTYALGLSYCGRQRTDGFIPEGWVTGSTKQRQNNAAKLVEVGLWERIEHGYHVPDFLRFNPSKAEQEQRAEAKRQAGSKGGKKAAERKRKAEEG